MGVRPYWKGYMKLSLVTCPVQMMPATSGSERVRFHTLNRKTRNRVVSRYVDAVTGRPVEEEDEVRGFEHGKDDYVMLEDDELEAVALESTKTIDIALFTEASAIEWVWLDTPYYLAPDGSVGEEAFAVIRDAMADQKMVGISRLVISRRERAVMLEPRDSGIVLWTLRYGDEVRDENDYFSKVNAKHPDAGLLTQLSKKMAKKTARWDPSMVADPVQEALLELIEEKTKEAGKEPSSKTKKPQDKGDHRESNVIDIMAALRKSLEKKK